MKAIALLFFASCSTSVTGLNGTKFRTYGNASHLMLTMPGITLSVDGMNHSTGTRAAFYGASHLVSAAGAAASPFIGGASAATRLAPAAVGIIPAFRTGSSTQP